jgi:pyruvate formate lyase activating enzyme
MIIGGIQKHSLIDFPGKVSCVLFLSGCNFRCPYCHNPDLVREGSLSPREFRDIQDFLQRRRYLLDGVVISGGEPTLQGDLVSLCRIIGDMGYSVKLDTNGSRPGVLKVLLDEDVVDYIAMDIKTDLDGYAAFFQKDTGSPDDILASIDIIRGSAIPHEFRTTCVKPFVDREVVDRISRLIEGSERYALQRLNTKSVLQPGFFIGDDRGIDDDELGVLRQIAGRRVRQCTIR